MYMCRIKSVPSSTSSTLHQCHHCTYTQEISISSTLHYATTAHIHNTSSTLHVLSSVPVSFTRCLWTISSECEGLAGGGGEETAYMWARENMQVTMTWKKRYAHNNVLAQPLYSVLAQPLYSVLVQPLYSVLAQPLYSVLAQPLYTGHIQ